MIDWRIINEPENPDNIVEVRDLTRRFGAKLALDRLTLNLPRGSVLGLVGANGAGKTTLIKHVLGLLRAQSGSVRVFGCDPTKNHAGVLGRIGYLAEENDLPGWMRIGELSRYMQAFFPNWDEMYAEKLRQAFELSASARVGNLSKGQRARAGLLAALAHRPELLLLDEPSSGLDPIVRRDILSAIIRTIADEGRTVLFSSHLLHEVERVSDSVAMIVRGRVAFSAALDDVKESHRCLTLRFAEPRSAPPAFVSALTWEGAGREWTALCGGSDAELRDAALRAGADIVAERVPSLDEIFVARAGAGAAVAGED
jgi:ABC-2 type transport system ATP-binding protein